MLRPLLLLLALLLPLARAKSTKDLMCAVASSLIFNASASRSGWVCSNATSDSDSDYCQWTGVSCDAQNNVTQILLNTSSVTGLAGGSLSPDLWSLTALDTLALREGMLTGPLSSEVAKLRRLTHLNLELNLLSGPLPSELGLLANLKELWLSGNALAGPIPSELGLLTQLSFLRLSSNQLSGSLPEHLFNLTGMTQAYLDFNRFTGTLSSNIGRLLSLRIFTATNNSLRGTIPTEIGLLSSSLQSFSLSYNRLSGGLPPEMGRNLRLQQLFLDHNSLTGPLHPTLPNMVQLRRLVLSSNRLNGSIPSSIDGCFRLTTLDLSGNLFSGTVPARLLYNLTRLTVLSLGNNPGFAPQSLNGTGLRSLSSLAYLSIPNANFGGSIPPSISALRSLTFMDLSTNSFTGTVPTELYALTGLQELGLGRIPTFARNEIYAPGLRNLSSLTFLSITNANFGGRIPSAIGNLTRLQSLVFAQNSFTGSIPAEVAALQRLRELFGSTNRLTGPLPSALYGLTALTALRMSANQLSGSISSDIGNLAQLRALNLEDNRLAGPVPPALGALGSLTYLNLNRNRLTGPVSEAWCALLPRLALLILCDDCGLDSAPDPDPDPSDYSLNSASASLRGCPLLTSLPYCLLAADIRSKCVGNLRGERSEVPALSVLAHSSSEEGVTVNVTLLSKNRALLTCAAFPLRADTRITSALQVETRGAAVALSGLSHQYSIQGLLPLEAYHVFCAARSVYGPRMNASAVQNTRTPVATGGRKRVALTSAPANLTSNSTADENVFRYSLSSLPSVAINVSVSLSDAAVVAVPSSVSFASADFVQEGSFILVGPAGSFTLRLVVSGPSALEYLSSEAVAVTIRGLDDPSAPALLTARFADNGGSAVLSFDAPTDLAGLGVQWDCALLLAGAAGGACSWLTASRLLLRFPAESEGRALPVPLDPVSLLPGKLRLACALPTCSSAPAPATSVPLQPPLSPVLPAIELLAGSVFGPLDEVVVDPSGSSGGAGRAFAQVEWTVACNAALDLRVLQDVFADYAATEKTLAAPLRIAADSLPPADYVLTLRLQNFLGASASASLSFTVQAAQTQVPPQVSILGGSPVVVRSLDTLLLRAVLLSGGSLPLVYAWTVSGADGEPLDLPSQSVDPRLFKLAVNGALLPGRTYAVSVSVSWGALSSSAAAQVLVQPGAIAVLLAGGDERVVDVAQRLTVSGNATLAANPGLSLAVYWECRVVSAQLFGSSCDSLLEAPSALEVHVSNGSLVPGLVYRLTCVCAAEGLTGSRSVLIRTTSAAPQVSLTSSVARANTGDLVLLSGRVQAAYPVLSAWTVTSSGVPVDIRNVSVSPLESALALSRLRPAIDYSLVVDCGRLVPGATYLFTVAVRGGQGYASASAQIAVNVAPALGTLVAAPVSGTAFNTTFLLRSLGWVAEAGGYPLRHSFLYDAQEAGLLTLGEGLSPFVSTLLPPAPELALRCVVVDSFGAAAEARSLVRVALGEGFSGASLLRTFSATVAAASTTADPDLALRTVNIVASFLAANQSALSDDAYDATVRDMCVALGSVAAAKDQSSALLDDVVGSFRVAYSADRGLSLETRDACLGLLGSLSAAIAAHLASPFQRVLCSDNGTHCQDAAPSPSTSMQPISNWTTAHKVAQLISLLQGTSGLGARRLSGRSLAADPSSALLAQTVSAAVASLSTGLALGLVPGQSVTLAAANVDIAVFSEFSFDLGNYTLRTASADGSAGSLIGLPADGLAACGESSTGAARLGLGQLIRSPYAGSDNLTSPVLRLTAFRSSYDVRAVARPDADFRMVVQFSAPTAFNSTRTPLSNATFNGTVEAQQWPGCRVRVGDSFVGCNCSLESFTAVNATFSCGLQSNLCPLTPLTRRALAAASDEDVREYGTLLQSAVRVVGDVFLKSRNPFELKTQESIVVLATVGAWVLVLVLGLVYFRRWDSLDHRVMLYAPPDLSASKKELKSIAHLQDMRRNLDNAFLTGALGEDLGEDHFEYNKRQNWIWWVSSLLYWCLPVGRQARNQLSVMVGGTLLPRFLQAVVRFHPLVWFFADSSMEKTRVLRFMTLFKTVLCTIFISTVFFSVYYPVDSTCVTLSETSAEECLAAPSRILRSLSECDWDEGSGSCTLRPPPRSFAFVITVSVLTTLVLAPLDMVVFLVLNVLCNRRPQLEAFGLDSYYWLGGSSNAPATFTDMNVSRAVLYVLRSLHAFELRLNEDSCSADELETMLFVLPQLGLRLDGHTVRLSRASALMHGTVSDRVAAVVRRSCQSAAVIIDNMRRLQRPSAKESYLLQHFIMEQFSPLYRVTLRRQFCHYAFDLPKRIHPLPWLLAWVFVISVDLFFIVWILLWGTSNNSMTLANWGANFGSTMFEEVFIVSFIRIFILNVVVVELMRPTLRRVYGWVLSRGAEVDLEALPGTALPVRGLAVHEGEPHALTNDAKQRTGFVTESYVLQYVSAARIVASHPEFAHLASAAVIHGIQDDEYVHLDNADLLLSSRNDDHVANVLAQSDVTRV